VRISRISASDFRAFPGGEPFVFDLGADGKNLLLHGENGAGKSSLFHALRLLFSPEIPAKPFTDYANVFLPGGAANPGLLAVDLTAGSPVDYRWDSGNLHPAANAGDATFREAARRSVFLDYKALLQTSLPHEKEDFVDLFDLVVETLLRDVEFNGELTVLKAWEELLAFTPTPPPPRKPDETEEEYSEALKELSTDSQQKREEAEKFWTKLTGFLIRIIPRANDYLAKHLQPFLSIELKASPGTQESDSPHRKLLLTATYAGHPVPHPALFLNEARLSAIALALYLAATVETKPPALVVSANGDSYLAPRLLLLDDPLLGLDLAHRSTLLDLLQRDEFFGWQIFLLTYDANWFELASDALDAGDAASNKRWVTHRLHAKLHEAGWEMPILMSNLPFLDRAWGHLQDGDYKAAGVYLRAAFESMLRDFCIERHQHVPLLENLRDYKTETLWPVVCKYVARGGSHLIDEGLKSEIELQRRYVLNPLCHNDPARPTREEARRAHAALSRLHALIVQDTAWPKQLNAELQEAAKAIVANDLSRLEKALMGHANPREFALLAACRLLATPNPPIAETAMLLRSAFDRMLWRYCDRKGLTFIMKCDANLSTRDLWIEAKIAAPALNATHAAFVAAIEAQDDLLLAPDPTSDVCVGKPQADLEALCQLFAGANWKTELHPGAVMDSF
jgi:energy-coupling factor transporter ATP-binding protein EcfA2